MPEGERVVAGTIVVIIIAVFFFSGAWFRWNDKADLRIDGGEIVLVNGLKCLKSD